MSVADDTPHRPRGARTSSWRVGLTAMAIVSGWLIPGLGHIVLGRVRRGIFFATLVLGSFALGMAHDGRLALRDDRQAPILSALQVVANAGVGVADLLARARVYGVATYSLPRDPAEREYGTRLTILRDRTKSIASIYGTAYLWAAGLMNLLLLFDIWDIGRGRND